MASRRVRARDGSEHVLVPVAEYQALLDAAEAAPISPALRRDIVAGLRASFESPEPPLDVDDFLAAYDAAHDAG
jgi:hypothetical protein